jgi:erythronate-4-phosphate dehydrogenase
MVSLIADDHIPFLKGVLEPFAKIKYVTGSQIDHKLVAKADGLIIRTRTICNTDLLEGSTVKFIATATIGFDHIDTDYCSRKRIAWHHSPGCNSSSVRQYVASALAILSIKHNFILKGKKIGIVGVGHVGSKVAQLARASGMIPLLNDPPRQRAEIHNWFDSLQEIKRSADIITFHVPLTIEGVDKTFHLADRSFFESLDKKPFIINSSRGPVVDSEAVKIALSEGKISGFAADVWENEPAIDRNLVEMADIATPHIAGYSVEGKANGTAACVQAASRFFGFGLDKWQPEYLPPPVHPTININAKDKSAEQVMAEAILGAYNVMQDDETFRKDPSRFENLRNYYPVRREFSAYKVHLLNPRHELITMLNNIGFIANSGF